MSQYFYNKYSVVYKYEGVLINTTYFAESSVGGQPTISLNPQNGYLTISGGHQVISAGSVEGTTVYKTNINGYLKYEVKIINGTRMIMEYTYEIRRLPSRGTDLISQNIVADANTYPIDGFHSDGYWYVRGVLYLDDWTPGIISITGDLQRGNGIIVNWGRPPTTITVNQYEVSYQLYRDNVAQGWSFMTNSITGSHAFTLPTDARVNGIEFRVRALISNGGWSNYRVSEKYNLNNNKIPTINLTTIDGRTFYENETFLISGTATDADIGNIVSVKYQVNNEPVRAIETKISAGTSIPFNKTLTLKNSRLMDGTTPVTEVLGDGSQHILKVWAEDDQGGKSPEQIRSFYVVANRAPVINVDNIANQNGAVNTDTLSITGRTSDPDGNALTAKYRINTGPLNDLPLTNGEWVLTFPIKQLKDGENNVIIEVIDSYNFKSTKTVQLKKEFKTSSLAQSVQRYKIEPPKGSAKGVILWVQREEGQTVTAEISMVDNGATESYQPMELTVTAPIGVGNFEDEFIYEADAPRTNIHLKLNITGTGSVILISGVLS